jgi:hypothetical protein
LTETASANASSQRVRRTPLVVQEHQVKVEELWLDKDVLAVRFDNRYLTQKARRGIDGNALIQKYLDGPLPDEMVKVSEAAENQVSKGNIDKRGPNYSKEKLKQVQRVMQHKRESRKNLKIKL